MIFISLVFTHQNPLIVFLSKVQSIGTPLTKSPYMFKKKTQKINILLEKYHDWFVLINILFYVSLLYYWYNYCQ